jgi:hypothetical protein
MMMQSVASGTSPAQARAKIVQWLGQQVLWFGWLVAGVGAGYTQEPPSENPIGQPTEHYYGAHGVGVRVHWEVEPSVVRVTEPFLLTLVVERVRNPTQVQRPKLRQRAEFVSRFEFVEPTPPPHIDAAAAVVRFPYRVRLRQQQLAEVPPLWFYYYNPAAPPGKQYPLTVAPAVPISLAPMPAEPSSPSQTAPVTTFQHAGASWLSLVAAEDPPWGQHPWQPTRAWWWGALLCPLLGALGIYGLWRGCYPDACRLARLRRDQLVDRTLRQLQQLERWTGLGADRNPTQHVSNAAGVQPPGLPQEMTCAWSWLHRAVVDYVQQRFELPPGLTAPRELTEALQQIGVPQSLLAELEERLRFCEQQRFAPVSSTHGIDVLARGMRHWLIRLEEQIEKLPLGRITETPGRRWIDKVAGAAGSVCLVTLMVVVSIGTIAMTVGSAGSVISATTDVATEVATPEQGEQEQRLHWWRVGESAFANGVAALQAGAPARQHFEAAAAAWERLWAAGGSTPALARNRARAYYLAEQLPAALLALQQGLTIAPWDSRLQQEWRQLRALVRLPAEPGWEQMCRPLSWGWYRSRLSPAEVWFVLLLGGSGAAAAELGYRISAHHRYRILMAWCSGVMLLVVGGWWLEHMYQQWSGQRQPWVLIAREGILRSGNAALFPPVCGEVPVPAGIEARCIRQRGGWMQLQLADGTRGWLPQENIWLLQLARPQIQAELTH